MLNKNKKAQLGETTTWIVATLMIIVVLIFFIYASSILAKKNNVFSIPKKAIGKAASYLGGSPQLGVWVDVKTSLAYILSENKYKDAIDSWIMEKEK